MVAKSKPQRYFVNRKRVQGKAKSRGKPIAAIMAQPEFGESGFSDRRADEAGRAQQMPPAR
jgi:hypothetical protein